MEKVLIKVDGQCIFAPTEEQWAGMDCQMITIVKKVGSLIDVPLKDRLFADYNTCKVYKKYDLMHDDRIPELLLKNLYPKYLALHNHQYLHTGAESYPEYTVVFIKATQNDSWKQFQKKEKIRLRLEMKKLLKWQRYQTRFKDFDFQYFRAMMSADNMMNLGNDDIDKLALSFTDYFRSPQHNILD